MLFEPSKRRVLFSLTKAQISLQVLFCILLQRQAKEW